MLKIAVILLLLSSTGFAEIGFRGELALFGQTSEDGIVGAHYIPQLEYEVQLGDLLTLQAEAAYHLRYNLGGYLEGILRQSYSSDLYRFNARLQTQQLEIVAGLQKLNFGPGRILRPLMWFDQIDPSDPLAIAQGVNGLTASWYSKQLLHIRAWALRTDERRSWELLDGEPDKLEYGGRIALPVAGGELAVNAHYRPSYLGFLTSSYYEDVDDVRLAADGFFDIGIGLWFEAMYKTLTAENSGEISDQTMVMIGADHTLPFGNGLHYSLEHLLYDYHILWPMNQGIAFDDKIAYTAISIDYPIGFFDQVSAMSLIDWENSNTINMLTWARSYDRLSINLTLFDYPEDGPALTLGNTTELGGDGLLLMLIFNH